MASLEKMQGKIVGDLKMGRKNYWVSFNPWNPGIIYSYKSGTPLFPLKSLF